MSMANPKKNRRTWLYISGDDEAKLADLVKALGPHYTESMVLTTLASAALHTCA